jgi:hypothetical protein
MTPSMLVRNCARAASAAEARFRIDAPVAPARAARVVALDEGAAGVARRLSGRPWASARFFVCEGGAPGSGRARDAADTLLLRGIDGSPAVLSEQLAGADVVVMIATEDAGAECALAIGRACAARGIMTAGLVLGDGYDADHAVAALRPHARVLLPSADEVDVTELLTALRA